MNHHLYSYCDPSEIFPQPQDDCLFNERVGSNEERELG